MTETCRRGHEWTTENTVWRLDGYRQCRTCKLAANLAWQAAYRDRVRAETLAAYGGCCARCGKTGQFGPPADPDALQLDHVQGDGAAERKWLLLGSGWEFCSWLKRQGFPDKGSRYQLLCSGCHLAKSAAEREAGNATA